MDKCPWSWRAFVAVVAVACSQISFGQSLQSVNFQFREEQVQGSPIGNVAIDSGLASSLTSNEFARLKFNLPDSKYFNIDEKSGFLRSAVKIDREEVCEGQAICKLTAEIIVYTNSGGIYDIYKAIRVDVEILDINDNAPKFPADSVSLSIPESSDMSEELPASSAVDKDVGTNSVRQYSFQDPTDTFTLAVHKNPDDSSYLGIVAKRKLDREVKDFYQVTVVATDGGFPQLTGSVLINITVSDINDKEPEFLQASYNESVPENVALSVPIMKVEAIDRDLGKNAEISYQFSSRVPQKIRQKFYIDEQTGEISAQGSIDYEEDKLFQFIVEAVDHGTPQQSSRTNVNLHVTDVNDNAPQININMSPTGTDVYENEPIGKFIAQVFALDADSGRNGAVTCSMSHENFSLDKFNDRTTDMYKVALARPLDYELSSTHRVSITCTDGGTPALSNSTTFIVNVIDVNDNRPEFIQTTYRKTVMENVEGEEEILQVSAHDSDSGEFGRVSYAIEDTYDGIFSIDSSSGVIKVLHMLDREYIPKYEFKVIARDNGPEKLSSTALVVITVDDDNDEPPRFQNPVYFGDVLENQPAGTAVGNASAVDPDTPTNSQMAYSIVPQGQDYSNFTIDPKTGVIKSTTRFDREAIDQYHFLVKVVDPTNIHFSSVCNFTVRVLDDNDHSPVIHMPMEENATLIVQHGTSVGTTITKISAHDGDEISSQHSYIVFLLEDGDPNQLFNLNRITGSLSLARIITGRDIRTYNLIIKVMDGGDPPRFDTKHLNIRVNGTILMASESSFSQNFLIVIILVGVTAVLALAILVTILLIRKIDQQRKKNRANQKNSEEKMYQLKKEEVFTNMSINNDDDSGSNNLNKRGRKEVSFSLDEESDLHNTSNGSSHPLTSFKGGANGISPFPEARMSAQKCGPIGNGMMNIPVRADRHGNARRSPRDEKNHVSDILKKTTEDTVSQSSEDTDPSDSGRGGSEDDSSHRGSGVDHEHNSKLFLQIYPRGVHPTADTKNRLQLYHQQKPGKPPPKTGRQTMAPSSSRDTTFTHSGPHQRSSHSSVTSDIESDFSGSRTSHSRSDADQSDSKSYQGQTFGNSGDSGRPTNQGLSFAPRDNTSRSVAQDWHSRLAAPYNNYNTSPLMRSFHGQAGNNFAVAPPMASVSTEHLARPRQDRYFPQPERAYKSSNRSFPLSLAASTQSSLLEEDDRTTTSGSFTITSEDLRQEVRPIIRDSVV